MCLCRISIFESTIRKFPTEEDLGSVYRRFFFFFRRIWRAREKEKKQILNPFSPFSNPTPLG